VASAAPHRRAARGLISLLRGDAGQPGDRLGLAALLADVPEPSETLDKSHAGALGHAPVESQEGQIMDQALGLDPATELTAQAQAAA
jgi:hypothetical protein